jgi:predicted permease
MLGRPKTIFRAHLHLYLVLRAYHSYLAFAIVWSFFAVMEAAVLHPLNVYIASVSGSLGFASGAISTGRLIQGIEKKGEYRQSRKNLLLALGLAIVIGAVLIYVIISETIPLSIVEQFESFYTVLPAFYFGYAITFRRWELKNGKEIHFEGAVIGTFYAIPKGLTWQQQFEYRRLHQSGNPAQG